MKTIRTASFAVILAFLPLLPNVAHSGVDNVDSNTDRIPRHTVIPEYPEIARRDRIEGEVQVCFNISRRGYPQRIAVRRSTHRIFEKTARKAVRKSTWLPVDDDVELTGIKACRTFRFTLVPVDETG